MKFYNTLSRSLEEFTPLDSNNVRMYACGPTVYNFFHIGNARCFTVFDMLRRYLQYRGYNVTFVQNFTDVDDKMIKRANEEGVTVKEVADKYIAEYMKDAAGLGIKPADVHPRATENIDEIIRLVETLIEKGHAYSVKVNDSDSDVYFRTLSFKGYGKLSHMPIDELEKGARVDISESKEDPLDFALWKAAKPGEPSWDSPWGKGRPGWHIECSAMSCKYLGESIDIHCGGADLAFPHHENEIAQSECASGKQFVKYWLHNGYINVDNKKMSKSLGNFKTVREIAEVYGYMPIRFFLLSAHYRTPVNFTAEVIESAKSALTRLYNCESALRFYTMNSTGEITEGERRTVERMNELKAKFIEVMDDDFNTADGIAVLFDIVREINTLLAAESKPSRALMVYCMGIYLELAELFGFTMPAEEAEGADGMTDEEILAAIERRAEAKKSKNYAEADRIRAELLEQGIILEDTRMGTSFKRK